MRSGGEHVPALVGVITEKNHRALFMVWVFLLSTSLSGACSLRCFKNARVFSVKTCREKYNFNCFCFFFSNLDYADGVWGEYFLGCFGCMSRKIIKINRCIQLKNVLISITKKSSVSMHLRLGMSQ